MMQWLYSATLFSIGVVLVVVRAWAGESGFQYFQNTELDYWRESGRETKPVGAVSKEKKPTPGTKPATSTFQWNKYLTPANDEFFKEGDYTPPAPFMEIARNPTEENIENWFRYLGMKNDLLHRLQEKLGDYAVRHPQRIAGLPQPYAGAMDSDPEAIKRIAARVELPIASAPDAKRFRLRLYFDSHCPHCERMMETVRELMQRGYWVELRQVDKDISARARIPFAVSSASADELKRYQIQSVPVLLVGDLKKQTYFKIQGYQPVGAVVAALGEGSNARSGRSLSEKL